ncbi:hypothetical protein B7494_g4877 [Chlorociboria aeruginascens]|nr:hypothetical protein B7494_g4877 [Chlorociboria aeruginascens]
MLNVSAMCRYVFSRISSRRFASTQSSRIRQLEVERKFIATPNVIPYLRSSERFKEHKSLGRQTNHDTYYDLHGLLFSKGVYIRQRDGHWEAKIRDGGDFVNSVFTEVQGDKAVKEVIEQNMAVSTDGVEINGILKPCADFVTDRESWIIDSRFRVDVDTTDFGHMVGEVELTRSLQFEDEVEKERLQEEMDHEIRDFMQLHPQVFQTGRPLGKLSAYFLTFPPTSGDTTSTLG